MMMLSERRFVIPSVADHRNLLQYLSGMVAKELHAEEIPVRFVITNIDNQGYHCEIGVISCVNKQGYPGELDALAMLNNLISPLNNPIF